MKHQKLKRSFLIFLCIVMSLSSASCGKALPAFTEEDPKKEEPAAEWSIYIYMVGSDLEDAGLDQLSKLTSTMVEEEAKREEEAYDQQVAERVKTFSEEVAAMGMTLPNVLYNKTAETVSEPKEKDVDATGYATYSLDMMMSCEIPEGVQFVIQTGGAKRWQSPYVNPNRSQCFVIDQYGLTEVSNEPVVNMANPDTLEEFMVFCKEYFPAKHEAMVFWDHGNAYGGFGMDDIFGTDLLTVREMVATMGEVKKLYPREDKLFDLIGFDACLMGELEVARLFKNYADYYLSSAEELSGLGWGYDRIIDALLSTPSLSPRELSEVIACANVANVQLEDFEGVFPATFSVYDLNKIEPVYDAYSALAKQALILSLKDVSNLTALSAAAQHTLAYAYGNNGGFNLIDLGGFMDNLSDLLPEESARVRKTLSDCVVFTEATTYFEGGSGMSVYFPARMTGLGSLRKYLTYTYDLSDNPDIDALYRYKITGGLNQQLWDYVETAGYGEVTCIDYYGMQDIPYLECELDGKGNMALTLPEELRRLTQSTSFGLIYVDGETGDTVYFSEMARTTEKDGRVSSDFDLTWPSLQGNELPAVVIGEDRDKVNYRMPIDYYGMDCYMLFTRNKKTGEYVISGITLNMDNGTGNADRTVIELEEGEEFSVAYQYGNLDSDLEETCYVDFVYSPDMTIEDRPLSDGWYLEYLRFDDLRSDIYYSPIVSFYVEDGKVIEQYVDPEINAFDIDEKK